MQHDDEIFACYSSGDSICAMIRKLIKNTVGRKHGIKRFRPYSLRKYFRRAARALGETTVEYLMGHSKGIDSLIATYEGLKDFDKFFLSECLLK